MMTLEQLTDQTIGVRGTPQREEFERRLSLLRRRHAYFEAVFGWMRRIPLIGIVLYVWWSSLVDEGLDGAIDAMCFSFLHDTNPTARWHSWYRKT